MAVQSPPIVPKPTVVKNASPLKISPTPGKTSPMTAMPKTTVPTIPTNSSTPAIPATPAILVFHILTFFALPFFHGS